MPKIAAYTLSAGLVLLGAGIPAAQEPPSPRLPHGRSPLAGWAVKR
jgi:hypothetical protein